MYCISSASQSETPVPLTITAVATASDASTYVVTQQSVVVTKHTVSKCSLFFSLHFFLAGELSTSRDHLWQLLLRQSVSLLWQSDRKADTLSNAFSLWSHVFRRRRGHFSDRCGAGRPQKSSVASHLPCTQRASNSDGGRIAHWRSFSFCLR